MIPDAPIGRVRATVYKVPTDKPEADGTFTRDATTIVVIEVEGGGHSCATTDDAALRPRFFNACFAERCLAGSPLNGQGGRR